MKTLLSIFFALLLATNVYGSSISTAPITVQVLNIEATDFATTTDAPETVYSFSIPGGTLDTDNRLRLTLTGDQAGGTGSTDMRVIYGSTTLILVATTPANDPAPWIIEVVLSADDATNAQVAHILIMGEDAIFDTGVGTSAEDSTGTLTFSVTIDTNDVNQNYTMTHAVLELLTN